MLLFVAATAFAQSAADFSPGFNPGARQGTERERYMEAENRFLNHDYELALNRYEAFIKDFPLSQYVPDAQFRRAVSLYRLGEYRASLDLFQRIEARYRSTRYLSYVPFWKGVVEYYLARYQASISDLQTFLAQHSSASKGSGSRTLPVLTSSSASELESQALLYSGMSEIALGLTNAAIDSLSRLIDRVQSPSNESYGLALLLSLYQKEKEYSKIIAVYERTDIANVDPKWQAQVRLYAAEAYFVSGKQDSARALYQSLEHARQDIAAVAFTRLFQMSAGDQEGQSRILQKAEQVLTGNTMVLSQFWLTVGIESYQQKKYDLSEFYFRRLWDIRANQHLPGSVPLYLAELLVRQNKDQDAIGILEGYLSEPWVAGAPVQPESSGTEPPTPGSGDGGPVPLPKTAAQGNDLQSVSSGAQPVPSYRDRILARLGGLYLANSDWNQARSYLDECRKDYPDSPVYSQVTYQYAYALYRQGDATASLASISTLMAEGKAGSNTADLLRLQAADEQKLGRISNAVVTLKDYITARPDDVGARIDLVRLLFESKSYGRVATEATDLLKSSTLLMRDRPRSYVDLKYMLGLSYVAQKEYKAAIAQLLPFKSLDAVPAEIKGQPVLAEIHPYILYYLGWCYYRSGQFNEAISAYGDLVQSSSGHPLAPQGSYLAGWAAYSSGQYAVAERFLRLARGFDTTSTLSIEASFLLGQTLLQEKKYDSAEQEFRELFMNHASSSLSDDARFEYADALARSGKIDAAAAAYRQLADKSPNSPLSSDGLYRRAQLFFEAGRFSQAREAFFLYRSTYPDGGQVDAALYWGGMAAVKLKEPSGALLLWERLIAEHPKSSFRSEAMYRAAQIYEGRGEYKTALNLYSELIARYPKEADAVHAQRTVDELVLLMSGLSQKEASLLVTINAEKKAQTQAGRAAILQLAQLVIYQEPASSNNRQIVIPLLNEVVAAASSDPGSAAQAQALLSELASQQGDYMKAANGFLDAAGLDPANRDRTAQSLYRAAQMLKLASRPNEMKALVDRITKNFPQSEWAAEARKLLEKQ